MNWRTSDSELTVQAACDAYHAAFMDNMPDRGFLPGRGQFEAAIAAACDVAVAAYIEQNPPCDCEGQS